MLCKKKMIVGLLAGLVFFGVGGAAGALAAECASTDCSAANTSFPCTCGNTALTADMQTPYCCAKSSTGAMYQSDCKNACGVNSCSYKTYTGICEISGGSIHEHYYDGYVAGILVSYDRKVNLYFKNADGSAFDYSGTYFNSTNTVASFSASGLWSSKLGICSLIGSANDGSSAVSPAFDYCVDKMKSGKWNCTLKIATTKDCVGDPIIVKLSSIASFYKDCGLGTKECLGPLNDYIGAYISMPWAASIGYSKKQWTDKCSAVGGNANFVSHAKKTSGCSTKYCPTEFYTCTCDCSAASVTASAATTSTTASATETTTATSGSKSNGSSCSANSECSSGVCSYTYCVPDSTYCGGVKDPMYFASGATAGNQWLDGVCRNGVWKTVLNGTGCSSFACDSGTCSNNKCAASTSGKMTIEQIQAMIAQIKELINSLIAQLAAMTS